MCHCATLPMGSSQGIVYSWEESYCYQHKLFLPKFKLKCFGCQPSGQKQRRTVTINIYKYCSFARSASSSSVALIPACIRFSCCSRLRLLQLLLPDFVCFSCSSPIASTSATASRLRLLQLLLPDCVRFCCSPY